MTRVLFVYYCSIVDNFEKKVFLSVKTCMPEKHKYLKYLYFYICKLKLV